jgi:uncharacterized protein (DUF433 family)
MKDYVEKSDDGYWIKGKRISLDSIVYAYQRGQSPESIQSSFPLLELEEIYGAVAFYLANQTEVDRAIREDETQFAEMHRESQQRNAEIYARIEKARAELLVGHS